MSTTPMGDYWKLRTEGGTVAVLGVRCPFCELQWMHRLPTRLLQSKRPYITLRCPRCDLEHTHAPKSKPRR